MLHHNPVAEHMFQQGNKAVVQRRNHSSLKMPAPGGGSLPLYPRCACCPFGYHIDLDFINYCQSLGTVDPSPGQKLRRDRRRQRQSMEIMLGLGPMFQQTDTLQMLPKVGETSEISTPTPVTESDRDEKKLAAPTANEKRLASAFANNALADVVQDFEKTLERSRTKSTSIERDSVCEQQEEARRRTCENRATTREKFFGEYEQHYVNNPKGCTGRTLPQERSLSSYDNVDNMRQVMSPNNVSVPAKDVDVESVHSCGSSSGSEMSQGALNYIREQMATSLNKIRDLEEKNREIPQLQSELARLKKTKRELECQVQTLQQEKRSIRSSYLPQQIAPVQLQTTVFNELMETKSTAIKAKLTREIGIQYSSPTPIVIKVESRTIGSNTEQIVGRDMCDRLYTETEIQKILKVRGDMRSVGLQVDSTPEEYEAWKVRGKESRGVFRPIVVSKGVQTMEVVKRTVEVEVLVKPETRSVGTSDHNTIDVLCEKCRVRKRSVGTGTERQVDVLCDSISGDPPLSLKQLGSITGRSLTDPMTQSMDALISTGTTSQASIGTQIGTTMRDAGCQPNAVVFSNKSSQSDAVVAKWKATDTTGLFELLDQGSNTENRGENEEGQLKVFRTRATNTIVVGHSEQGTNTIQVKLLEAAANTECVEQKHVAVTVAEKELPAQQVEMAVEATVPKHVTVGCEDVNSCVTSQTKLRELSRQAGDGQMKMSVNKVLGSPVTESSGTSRIPRPSIASPKVEKKPMAVLKRQDTYTVEDLIVAVNQSQLLNEEQPLQEVVEAPCSRKKDWICGIKQKQTLTSDLIGLQVNQDVAALAEKGEEAVDRMPISLANLSIPSNDRPMSLVQELEESATQKDDDELVEESEIDLTQKLSKLTELPELPETVSRTTITSTTVLKVRKQPTSRESLSEEDKKKQFPNLPRKTARPTREMSGALKVINDSLMKSMDGHSLLNANTIVRREWFQVSSSQSADGLDVEDYLDCFEEYSNHLLRYMVNLTDANGNTAMHYAVSHGNFDIVSILLDSKVCHVNQMNNAGYTCVMLVSLVKLIKPSHRHVVQRLFQMSDVNVKAKKHNQTALMLAVSHGNLDMVQILLEAGADINIQDEDGSTALMCAAEHGKIDIVKLLLAQPDCDSSVQDVDGSPALKIALDAGYRDIGILLYAHDHMSRHRSPHSTLPRKSKLTTASMTSSARFSPSASCPSSPAPTRKYFDQRK